MTTTRCRECHRPLNNPRHAAAGIGPRCAEKLGLEFKKPARQKVARAPRKPERLRKAQVVEAPLLPFEEWQGAQAEAVSTDEA